MADIIQVQTTTSTKEEAAKIGDYLLSAQLAACVKISGPVTSTYRWKDKIEHSEEWMCTIMTEGRIYSKVEEAIKQQHSYDLPEIIATIVDHRSNEYFHWVSDNVI